MKGICFLLLTLAAALLAEADTAVMLEVTPEGAFYRLPSTAPTAPAAGSPGTDSGLLWHFSQVQGLTQKTCPMGNNGEFVFTGGWYGGGMMFQGYSGEGTVLWQSEPELGPNEYWTSLGTGTSAADDADLFWLVRVFSVWNDNGTPGYTSDDFLVSENNVQVCLFNGASSDPLWTWDGSGSFATGWIDQAGKYQCSPDGSVFALGGETGGHLAVAVFHHDSPEPVLMYENSSFTYSPRQLRLTADASRMIFSAGATLLRVNTSTGELEDTYDLGASTDCFGVSPDGSVVAYGFTSARLAVWDGTGYALSWSRSVSGYYAGAAAVAGDNSTVFFGFYKSNYLSNRILRFDASSSTPVWTYDYPTGSGANQDVVSWMDCSADGRWLAVSSWGCESGGGDEVIVLDDTSPSAPVFSINTPGSMFHVDITPDGSLLSAAGKHVHANVFGSGTDVYMAQLSTTGVEGAGSCGLFVSAAPNPCAGAPTLELRLSEPGTVELSVFDLAGRPVHSVSLGLLAPGNHSVAVPAGLANGVYLARVTSGGEAASAKVVISR